jgi:hypothetical protein
MVLRMSVKFKSLVAGGRFFGNCRYGTSQETMRRALGVITDIIMKPHRLPHGPMNPGKIFARGVGT